MQEVSGALSVGRCAENGAPVLLQHLKERRLIERITFVAFLSAFY
jgi:hypothetical protein